MSKAHRYVELPVACSSLLSARASYFWDVKGAGPYMSWRQRVKLTVMWSCPWGSRCFLRDRMFLRQVRSMAICHENQGMRLTFMLSYPWGLPLVVWAATRTCRLLLSAKTECFWDKLGAFENRGARLIVMLICPWLAAHCVRNKILKMRTTRKNSINLRAVIIKSTTWSHIHWNIITVFILTNLSNSWRPLELVFGFKTSVFFVIYVIT